MRNIGIYLRRRAFWDWLLQIWGKLLMNIGIQLRRRASCNSLLWMWGKLLMNIGRHLRRKLSTAGCCKSFEGEASLTNLRKIAILRTDCLWLITYILVCTFSILRKSKKIIFKPFRWSCFGFLICLKFSANFHLLYIADNSVK